jgi:hypothetical protein
VIQIRDLFANFQKNIAMTINEGLIAELKHEAASTKKMLEAA